MSQLPQIGRIVTYTLTEKDAEAINRRRQDAREHMDEHKRNCIGVQIHVGNDVRPGDQFPMMIAKVWEDPPRPQSSVNGNAFVDGNDTYWVTSVAVGEGPGTWRWNTVAKAA